MTTYNEEDIRRFVSGWMTEAESQAFEKAMETDKDLAVSVLLANAVLSESKVEANRKLELMQQWELESVEQSATVAETPTDSTTLVPHKKWYYYLIPGLLILICLIVLVVKIIIPWQANEVPPVNKNIAALSPEQQEVYKAVSQYLASAESQWPKNEEQALKGFNLPVLGNKPADDKSWDYYLNQQHFDVDKAWTLLVDSLQYPTFPDGDYQVAFLKVFYDKPHFKTSIIPSEVFRKKLEADIQANDMTSDEFKEHRDYYFKARLVEGGTPLTLDEVKRYHLEVGE
jgi:hypothetical protein